MLNSDTIERNLRMIHAYKNHTAENHIIYCLAALGVGSNEVARHLGITNPNVCRWRKPYDDGGRPIPKKYLDRLYEMLREAVEIADRLYDPKIDENLYGLSLHGAIYRGKRCLALRGA